MVQNAFSNLFFLHATDYLRETSNLVRQQTVNDLCYTCKGCWQLSAYQRIRLSLQGSSEASFSTFS